MNTQTQPSIKDLPKWVQDKINQFNSRPARRTEPGRPADDRVQGWTFIEAQS